MKNRNLSAKFMAISRLTFKTFIGQPIGVMIAFVAPIILFVIIPYLIKGMLNQSMANVLYDVEPGLLLTPSIIIGTLGIPITFSAMKETEMLKKMNVVGIKPGIFILAFVGTFLIIIILATTLLYALSKALWQNDAPEPAGAAILIPFFLLIVISIIIGLLIGNVTRSQGSAFALGIASFLPVIFLSGLIFAQMDGWIADFAKAIPQHDLVALFRSAWHNNVLGIEDYKIPTPITPMTPNGFRVVDITLFNSDISNNILAYVYPIGVISVMTGGIIKKFTWE